MPIYPVLLPDERVITISPAPGLSEAEIEVKIQEMIDAAFPGAKRLPTMKEIPPELVGLPEDAWRWNEGLGIMQAAFEVREVWDEWRQRRHYYLQEADWRMQRAQDRLLLHNREIQRLSPEGVTALQEEGLALAAYREAWRNLPGSCKDPRQCTRPPRPWLGEDPDDPL